MISILLHHPHYGSSQLNDLKH